MVKYQRLAAALSIAGLAALAVIALPGKAEAWWCCRVGIALPPVVAAPPLYAPPPVYYAPPPAYYPPPQRVWVPPHWQGSVWVPGHWA
jgi:hypothetical protein